MHNCLRLDNIVHIKCVCDNFIQATVTSKGKKAKQRKGTHSKGTQRKAMHRRREAKPRKAKQNRWAQSKAKQNKTNQCEETLINWNQRKAKQIETSGKPLLESGFRKHIMCMVYCNITLCSYILILSSSITITLLYSYTHSASFPIRSFPPSARGSPVAPLGPWFRVSCPLLVLWSRGFRFPWGWPLAAASLLAPLHHCSLWSRRRPVGRLGGVAVGPVGSASGKFHYGDTRFKGPE